MDQVKFFAIRKAYLTRRIEMNLLTFVMCFYKYGLLSIVGRGNKGPGIRDFLHNTDSLSHQLRPFDKCPLSSFWQLLRI